MLKGINRSVLVVRTDRSSKFEAVYFVMKKSVPFDRGDVLKEANRIVGESGMLPRKARIRVKSVLLYLLFALGGALLASGIWLAAVFGG